MVHNLQLSNHLPLYKNNVFNEYFMIKHNPSQTPTPDKVQQIISLASGSLLK